MAGIKLTSKQRAFAKHYVLTGKPSESYIKAGYKTDAMKPESIARRAQYTLESVNVQSMIATLQNKAIVEDYEEVESVLNRLRKVANGDLFDFFDYHFDDDGNVEKIKLAKGVKSTAEMPKEIRMLVKKFKVNRKDNSVEVELHDPMLALRDICRIKGFDAKKEIEIDASETLLSLLSDDE